MKNIKVQDDQGIRYLLSLLGSNRRYWLIAIIFIFVYFFGQYITTLSNKDPEIEKKSVMSSYDISEDNHSFVIRNVVNTHKNGIYLIAFNIESLDSDCKQFSNLHTAGLCDGNFNVYLFSSYGDRMLVSPLSFDKTLQSMAFRTTFVANGTYSHLLFERVNQSKMMALRITNMKISYLENTSAQFVSELRPTVVGETNFPVLIPANDVSSTDKNYRFTKNGQMIGQVFKSIDSIITSVDLKLNFIGNGGLGSYHLELREVVFKNGALSISPNVMAYYYFSRAQADADLGIAPNVYRIPAVSNSLQKDKYYFIGISNDGVKFDYFNNLELLGYKDHRSENEKAVMISKRGKIKDLGLLYFGVNGVKYASYNGERILTNAVVQDIGGGRGIYKYKSNGTPTDYLDIYYVKSKAGNRYALMYDGVQRGISGKANNKTEFIYKFNTIYPFYRTSIQIKPLADQFVDCRISISTDNHQWRMLEYREDREDNTLDTLVVGDGKIREIFVKVTYEEDDLKYNPNNLFGIRDIQVESELLIN